MPRVKKICSNCKKTIFVDQNEFCCPCCGEFFADMNNDQVLQHHEDEQINEDIDSLTERERENRKAANKAGLRVWLICIGVTFLLSGVLAFFSIADYDEGKGMAAFSTVLWICVLAAGPLIPIVNLVRYKRKLNDQIIKVDIRHGYKDGRFKGVTALSSICCFLTVFPILIGLSLLLNPKIVFQHLHYWWLIGVVLVYSLIIIALSLLAMQLYGKQYYQIIGKEKQHKAIMTKNCITIVGVSLSFFLIMAGIFTLSNKTYTINNAQEFNILGNMPFAEKCNYILESDLDFKGQSSNGWSGIVYYYGVFDGKNHTISNLNYVGNATETTQKCGTFNYSDGLVGVNYGTIKNVNFDNCVFKLTYTESQNVDNAFLGILTGENGGIIENCSVKNCFIEYRLQRGLREGADFRFNSLIGMNAAYGEKRFYIYEDPPYEGKSTNNKAIFNKAFLADDGYTLVEYENISDIYYTFNGHSYKVYKQKMTWLQAEEYCESMGGHLVSITSQEEQNYVSGLVTKENVASWIGAYLKDDNSFSWVTGETFQYSNWDQNEPSYMYKNEKEPYVGMYANDTDTQFSTTGKWNDLRSSTDTIKGFVCEWDYINTR